MPVDLSVICNANMKTVEYSHLGDYFRTNYYIFLKKESRRWYFYPVEKTEEKMIITEATYTDSGNFLKTLKDEVGAVTNYSYDEKKGTLQSVTDADRQTQERFERLIEGMKQAQGLTKVEG